MVPNLKTTNPPRLAARLLRTMLRNELYEEVSGDLQEQFDKDMKRSPLRAKLRYWYQTFNYVRPFALRRRQQKNTATSMFTNNLKIGWRQMVRQKMYSSIKIGGFSLGIAASLLITLYIIEELSYDSQATKADRIYRVYQEYTGTDETFRWVWFQAPFAKTIKKDFPEIELAGRYNNGELFGVGNGQIRRDDQPDNSYEDGITYMDQELLELLEVPFVYGDVKHSLDEPFEIVITRSRADKYFPGENPIGRLLVWNNNAANPLKVGGVIEDFPRNSHLEFKFMIGMTQREMWPGEQDYWGATNYPTYIRIAEGADVKALEEKLHTVSQTYSKNADANFLKNITYALQPLRDIHLKTSSLGIDAPNANAGDIRFVWLFGAIAVFIVLIACINFINLTTAKSASRAKEVGLRKTVGSLRGHLIRQYLVESMLFSLLSFLIGVTLAWLALPLFNNMAGKSLLFPWTEIWFVPIILGASIVVGFLAGIYPSFYLSSFKPVDVLKGSFARSSKNAFTRSTLVVFQFTTSVVLIIATVVIYTQMNHILNAKLGYDKEQVVIINSTGTMGKQVYAFKEELLNISAVKSATIADYLPVRGTKRNGNGFYVEGQEKRDELSVSGQFWRVDPDYANTLGLKVTDGRFFDRNITSDSSAVVVNQEMVRRLKLENPIGTVIENYRKWTIVGVVEDFYYESMRTKIEPLALVVRDPSTNTVSVKLSTTDVAGTMSAIEAVWKKFSPNQPIRTAFLDDSFAVMYDDVKRMGQVFTSFAVLAIVVACLGLFALSAFMVEQRGKEISIRLVLGATVRSIFSLLTVNFVKLVLISIVIASPLAWYLMNEWLKGFTYKITIGWEVFVVAGSTALLIALTTISYQSVRAGLIRPVNNLRAE